MRGEEIRFSESGNLENWPWHHEKFPFGLEHFCLCWLFFPNAFYNPIYHLLFELKGNKISTLLQYMCWRGKGREFIFWCML